MADRSYSHLSVIIVDDVRAMRTILRSMLRDLGIQNVAEAGDGAEALEILRGQRKDLIITDLTMAPINGIEFARRLRQPKNLNAFVPILMVSAHNEKTMIRDAIDAGISAFLLKPITPVALAEKLKMLIERPAPLVQAASYHGPDRRRRAVWIRTDRRSPSPDQHQSVWSIEPEEG
jgi:two-component system chemotaxis response regulator CheY